MLRQQIINRLIQFRAIQSVSNWISNFSVRLRERILPRKPGEGKSLSFRGIWQLGLLQSR
jgi:hypothetical protein